MAWRWPVERSWVHTKNTLSITDYRDYCMIAAKSMTIGTSVRINVYLWCKLKYIHKSLVWYNLGSNLGINWKVIFSVENSDTESFLAAKRKRYSHKLEARNGAGLHKYLFYLLTNRLIAIKPWLTALYYIILTNILYYLSKSVEVIIKPAKSKALNLIDLLHKFARSGSPKISRSKPRIAIGWQHQSISGQNIAGTDRDN